MKQATNGITSNISETGKILEESIASSFTFYSIVDLTCHYSWYYVQLNGLIEYAY